VVSNRLVAFDWMSDGVEELQELDVWNVNEPSDGGTKTPEHGPGDGGKDVGK